MVSANWETHIEDSMRPQQKNQEKVSFYLLYRIWKCTFGKDDTLSIYKSFFLKISKQELQFA